MSGTSSWYQLEIWSQASLESAPHRAELARVCRNNREAMDRIVDDLLVQETIRGEDFRRTLSEFSKIPEENLVGEVKTGQMAVA